MANLLIGDVHGCYNELMKVLEKANFSSDDTIWLTGDLVARGPNSLEVLRFVKKHNMQIRLSLGNHDIHLLAVHAGISKSHKNDCTDTILSAPDCDELMNWLRVQPLMQIDEENKIIMAHAGISPQWDLQTAKNCARELNLMLSSNIYTLFLESMYGYYPDLWKEDLKGTSRLRYIANAFTRMRYCYKEDGRLDFSCKKSPEDAPNRLKPWFSLRSKIPPDYSIVFGHWASLNGQCDVDNIYALDTGCCWNGKLTCLRWEDKMYFKKENKTKK